VPAGTTSMTWNSTAALGSISLAIVPNGLSAADVAMIRKNVVAAANAYLKAADAQGYGAPIAGRYQWGSNSVVLNNALILALAFDFTQDRRHLDAVTAAMDYILGRNPMDKSYVSGHGERPLMNPHHRFWARQADPVLPGPPPGALAGGPNSSLQDPRARTLAGCAPQKCYEDHYQAYSLNEVCLNWNAPLAWVAAFLDEQKR
jgi:endoglucanase